MPDVEPPSGRTSESKALPNTEPPPLLDQMVFQHRLGPPLFSRAEHTEHMLLLGRFRSALARDGFFDEDGELWNPGGTLVAQSRQLALLIGAQT
jgi:hypothetical protein